MQPDCPAAHSMDTQWFAVDLEGHIGLFETGEPGPVPVEARSDEGAYERLKHLFFAAPGMLLLNAPAETIVHAHELLAERSGRPTDPYFVDSRLCMLLRSKQHLSQIGIGAEVGPEVVTSEGVVFSVHVQDIGAKFGARRCNDRDWRVSKVLSREGTKLRRELKSVFASSLRYFA